MQPVIPVLLAGGLGKRLWPISRKSYPKQFSNFVDNNSLFQQSALRLISSDKMSFSKHMIITNSEYRFIVCEQFQKISIDPGPIIIEPESKNTAPAILAAALYSYAQDKDAVLLISPSDHVIPDIEAFHNALARGLKDVSDGKIVTLGISPSRPETGYGYLSLSTETKNGSMLVDRFIEKPDEANAKSMMSDGNFLWNAGIFLFKAEDLILAYKNFAFDCLKLTKHALETAQLDLGFLRLNPDPWSKLKNISIDFAIMEKVKNLVAIPFTSKWSDLGDWGAVWVEANKNELGTALSNSAHAIDCSDTLLRSENKDQQIVGLGLNNIIAIAMSDAVLIAQKDRVQDIKKIVDHLKINDIKQAESHLKDFRPWGWFECLKLGDCFQVKRIFVNPGAAISLQSHNYRSEHWIVVEGLAKVTIDEEINFVNPGNSVFIPKGAKHRMENQTEKPLVIIEVQIGTYFGEDDIIRYEDLYSRK
ncbi:mannose-1-phosphate guanylyltransferase/mannose-6-phosphate isomerase [Alphaproteobacteria bacterium]|nr:mannose-1-phosphate guanylyltransferase/mannose-6-phosphate isomerase [Alphaproteobacteria bacterium]